nr:cation:proton antiporter [Nocardia sp. CS682]
MATTMNELDIERAYLIAGVALLLAATLPRLFKDRAITAPMLMLGVGAVGGLVIGPTGLRAVSPLSHPTVIEHVAELCVIVALMGVGLAIDRPLHWRTWGSTWRLLLITMPLCIAAVAVFGWWAAALTPAAAVLLAAVLAPTDPVLASDVQVEGPTPGGASSAEEDDEVRFALTSEAGLNDALAFPFVYLAIFLATHGSVQNWFAGWFAWELLGKIAVGAVLGAIVGDLLGRGLFRFPIENARLADQGEPIAALAAVFAVYGLTELVGGYGFLAVFACAIAMRRIERDSGYHEQMHSLVEQLEHVLTLVVLLLGAALTTGLLTALSWQGVALGVLLVFVFRPFAGWLALQRCDEMAPKERAVTAFFGVRGIGSIYYVSYGLTQADLSSEAEALWAITAFTIVLSVLVHGASAGWVMKHLENIRGKESA